MSQTQVPVWDLPVRVVHWGMAALLPCLWWTAENAEMRWHMRFGLLLLFLVLFRLAWGVLGSRTARFVTFVRRPTAALGYLLGRRGAVAPQIGHNPAGAWSVVALLAVLAMQLVTGLFAGDPYDGATGPLNHLVGVMRADWLTDWHHLLFDAVLVLVGIHLAAIGFYTLIRREVLIEPMFTGRRMVEKGVAGNEPAPAWRALLCAILAAMVVGWVASSPGV